VRRIAVLLCLLVPATAQASFRHPSANDRPKTRWWWADPYDQQEIAAEVDAIAKAGFGGAEIAFNESSWATPDQRSSLQTALAAARRDGIRIDMTMGAAWPVTTPNTKPATGLSEKEVAYGRIDVPGGVPFSGPVPPPRDNPSGGTLLAAVGARVITAGPPVLAPLPGPNTVRPLAAPTTSTILDPASLTVLDVTGGNVSWTPPSGGQWIVFGFWQRPSSEGVMDHFSARSAAAVTAFLDSDQLGPAAAALPGTGGDFFEDSLELDALELMWTDDFAEQFKARRGYDLLKYLPVLVVQGQHQYPVPNATPPADFDLPGDLGARVRHDYLRTLTDLYVDNHLKVFQRWARTHGMRFRTQAAFGAALDPTRSARALAHSGAGADDESLNAGDPAPLGDSNWRFAFDHFRSVAGGVHQGGGTEIGTELGAMFFRDQQASLELYKALMDKEWAAGITRPIIHGFAYQPPGSAWPGRDQFTGIVAQSWNQANFPQWSMFRALNDYWARGNHVLKRGRPRTDVAVYRDGFLTSAATYQALGTDLPNYQLEPATGFGVFADPQGGQRVDDTAALKPTPLFDGEALERAGYTFEYVDPVGLRGQTGRTLFPHGPRYRALVLDTRALPAAAAESIASAAEHGLAVVVVGDPPAAGRSGAHPEAEDARVQSAVARLLKAPRVRRVATQADVAAALPIRPAMQPSRPLPVYSQRRSNTFYLWNAGDRAQRFDASFAVRGTPVQLDLWTGAIRRVATWRTRARRTIVPLTLEPGETRVLRFRRAHVRHLRATSTESAVLRGRFAELRDTAGGERTYRVRRRTRHLRLPQLPAPLTPKAWELHVDGVGPNGPEPHDLKLDALADWRDIDTLSGASGTGTYTTTLDLPARWLTPRRGVYLQLGAIGGAAQVTVNGRAAGPQVVPDPRIDITRLLHTGANQLRVVVATTLKNRMVALARSGDPNAAIYLAQPATQPYGLLGPVRLVPFSRTRVRLR
jgi:hypothetical protein